MKFLMKKKKVSRIVPNFINIKKNKKKTFFISLIFFFFFNAWVYIGEAEKEIRAFKLAKFICSNTRYLKGFPHEKRTAISKFTRDWMGGDNE